MRRGYAAAHFICNIPPTEPKKLIGGTLTKTLTAHRAEGAYRRYTYKNSYRPQSPSRLWAVCFKKFGVATQSSNYMGQLLYRHNCNLKPILF